MNLTRTWETISSKPKLLALLWALGAFGLLGLNLRRDVARLLAHYSWEPVSRQTLHMSVSSPGVMEAVRVAELKSEVDETVIKKFAQEGQAVKEGQLLLELSRTKTQLEYEQKKNTFRNADLDYKKAVREYAVQNKLYQNQAVSRSQLEEAERNQEKAKASRDISLQELQLMEKKLATTLVRSPLNGVVMKDHTTLGAAVASGKELITVGDVSEFVVRTKVDELDIKQVRIGQTVEIQPDAYPDASMRGVVRSIAIQAERETFAKVEVLIDITDRAGLELKHNLSVRTQIITDQIPNAVGVSIKAIQNKIGNRAWVLVQNKLHLIRQCEVTLGRPAGDLVEVLGGLQAGELVGIPLITSKDL